MVCGCARARAQLIAKIINFADLRSIWMAMMMIWMSVNLVVVAGAWIFHLFFFLFVVCCCCLTPSANFGENWLGLCFTGYLWIVNGDRRCFSHVISCWLFDFNDICQFRVHSDWINLNCERNVDSFQVIYVHNSFCLKKKKKEAKLGEAIRSHIQRFKSIASQSNMFCLRMSNV